MKRWRTILTIAGGLGAAGALAGAIWAHSLGPAPLGKNLEYSHVVLDREGRLLRAYATTEGRWRLPVSERDVDPRFLKLLFTYEDKRFREHHGIDPLSMGRAAVQLVSRGQIISGGSTISMQVARLLEPRERRSLGAKMRQIVRALELERALGKDGVLALYLTLAPYGGNLEGVRAASLAYFGKEPRKLSLAEAALLVALPQSPELRRPDRFPTAARAARDRVLDRAALAGLHATRRNRTGKNPAGSARTQTDCRCWHPMRPIRWCCLSPIAASIVLRSIFSCKRICKSLRTSVRKLSDRTFPSLFSRSTM